MLSVLVELLAPCLPMRRAPWLNALDLSCILPVTGVDAVADGYIAEPIPTRLPPSFIYQVRDAATDRHLLRLLLGSRPPSVGATVNWNGPL